MKKGLKVLTVCWLVLALFPRQVTWAAETPPPKVGDVVFHEQFKSFTDPEQRVAPGWHVWSDNQCWCEGGESCQCFTPEYKQSNPVNTYPYRTHGGDGDNAQQYFTLYAGHHGGLWRQFPVTPGMILEVHAWAMGWGGTEDDPLSYAQGQEMRMRIGVDPTGGTNPNAASVVWGAIYELPNNNVWHEVPVVQVTAKQGLVTVFLSSNPKYPTKHNDSYWDDVYAIYKGGALPLVAPAPVGDGVGRVITPGMVGTAAKGLPAPAVPDPVLDGLVAGNEQPAVTGGAPVGELFLGGLLLSVVFGFTSKRTSKRERIK